MNSEKKGALLIALSAILLASDAIFAKLAYAAGVNVMTTLAVRFLPGTLIFLVTVLISGQSLHLPHDMLGLFAFVAIIYVVSSVLVLNAFIALPASLAIMLFYIFPAITGILAYFIDGERMSKIRVLALVLSACGLVLLLWSSFEKVSMAGILFALGAALTNAVYLIYFPKVLTRVHQLTFITWLFFLSSIFFGLIGSISGKLDLSISLPGWLYLLGLSVIASAFATLAYIFGMPLTGPTLAAIVFTLEPPITAFLAFLVFAETMMGWQIVGAGLVIVAVLLSQIKSKSPTDSLKNVQPL